MARHRFDEKDDRVKWGGPALTESRGKQSNDNGGQDSDTSGELATDSDSVQQPG